MKNLAIILTVILISCSKSDTPTYIPNESLATKQLSNKGQSKKLIKCDFGSKLKKSSQPSVGVQAAPTVRRGKKPKQPPTPPQPTYEKIILLDFDGHVSTHPDWTAYTGGQPINAAPANLTTAQMQYVTDSVAADYGSYPVLFTTSEAEYNTYPINKRHRHVITETAWFGFVGGVAYIYSMINGQDAESWSYPSMLGYSAFNIRTAVTHEIGHAVGLFHQARWMNNGVEVTTKTETSVLVESYHSGYGSHGFHLGVGYWNRYNILRVDGINDAGQKQNDTLIIGKTIRNSQYHNYQ